MSCQYNGSCPCESGWCNGPKNNMGADCVPYLMSAYRRITDSFPRLRIGDIVKHFKAEFNTEDDPNKYMYKILNIAYTFDEIPQVVYQSLYGPKFTVWVRPYEDFMAEVDKIKHPEVNQRYVYQFVARDT